MPDYSNSGIFSWEHLTSMILSGAAARLGGDKLLANSNATAMVQVQCLQLVTLTKAMRVGSQFSLYGFNSDVL